MTLSPLSSASAEAAPQYCTFVVDGLLFGVRVQEVQEVLRFQPLTPVPLAADSVRGLLNLRGQIVTAVCLRRCLSRPLREGDDLPLNVVVRSRGEAVSLLVDEVGDVVDTTGFDLLPPPANLPPAVRDLLEGVIALPDSILLVLDFDRAVDVPHDASPGGTS
ncbi:chemotaxis protein CheW [Nocardioides campestrisoli]|uniref:chemotaxis protein CheW n=1 Tax=Nocardioides campestrisoli TaxID=2736757 RepID=UPI0015E6EE6F|nr:chemotaxis protein CheW [Nocardioides campestrisoli]